MFSNAVRALRKIGIAEGISFLVLLLIAMPLKYWADMPIMVQIVGSIHGFLFGAYLIALLVVWIRRRWSFWRVLVAGIASLLPFGTFVLDRRLRKEE
ncbi:DUF3817 domain-containing protein [Cohnella nanjingensis]|uniref:DUF3817 domain-containing protein n=1 Tax=Cohnella nanjingensis TaxID=1387779 RepID=A0A7X0RUK2_9BACL|nr:DUF3817 domain-containing protein [Cohnella nanjingensis]MBB6672766.1 DUF3817 domain-containing protein [Cohnella nanjingensis]